MNWRDSRDLLLKHKRALEKVVQEDAFSCTTAKAKRYLLAINSALSKPHQWDIVPGKWGPNGYGPAIADIVSEAELHKRLNAVEEDFYTSEAAE